MSQPTVNHQVETSQKNCPFCDKAYKKLGNHLANCPKREGKDYSIFMSNKTLRKYNSKKSTYCPYCSKKFARLDTHLRVSATCKPKSHEANTSIQPHDVSATRDLQPQTTNSTTANHMLQGLNTPKILPPFKTPNDSDLWGEIDLYVAEHLVPAIMDARSPEEKHAILCQGIYEHMISKFGIRSITSNKKKRKRFHERNLKKLRKEKNAAKKDLRQARRQTNNKEVVEELSRKFYRLLRLHNKEKKVSLQAKM